MTAPLSLSRPEWLELALRIARPVLEAGSRGALAAEMPAETAPGVPAYARSDYGPLEAVGRTLSGLAPWLARPAAEPAEEGLRAEFAELARRTVAGGVDPDGAGAFSFFRARPEEGRSPFLPHQGLVDASFLARALLHARSELWEKLAPATREAVIRAFQATRRHRPYFNNWLLFAGVIEAFLSAVGAEADPMRIDYALRQHEQWYVGDGLYRDGPEYHLDYYNSLVIHPYLLDLLEFLPPGCDDWSERWPVFADRAQRYALLLERMIAPDGSFPAAGRSLCYRCGAFHLLALLAWRDLLPEKLPPAQVRAALGAVIVRTLGAPGTFDERGWLRLGLAGHQPSLAEGYLSTGSLYLCLAAFLPLGLPATHPFWSAPPRPWSGVQIWTGRTDVFPS